MRFAITLGVGVALVVAVASAKGTAPAPAKGDAAPAAAPAPKAVPDLPERTIEKQVGNFIYKVTFRPGNLKPNRLADFKVELYRALESPDPVNGDREPLADSLPVASVQAPTPAPEGKSHKAAEPPPPPVRYVLWPEGDPGKFVFHFTPAEDGIYQLTLSGNAKASDEGEAAPFSAAFRLGVGTSAADTELSQGETPRRARDSDDTDDGLSQIQRAMKQIGQRYMDLEEIADHSTKGTRVDGAAAAAEAKAIIELFSQVKGQVPADHAADTGEFDTLADAAREHLNSVSTAFGSNDSAAARAALTKLQIQSCDQCHAKYWYGVTDDVSAWPSFHQKATKAAAE